jgi:hypothetical protein
VALHGKAGVFNQFFPMQGLGASTAQSALTAFAPIKQL